MTLQRKLCSDYPRWPLHSGIDDQRGTAGFLFYTSPVLSIWSRSIWSFPSHAGHRCPVIESSQSVLGGIFFYNSFLCSVIYRIVIRFSRWSCYSPPGSILGFNRTHLDLWWPRIGQYGNRGVLYAFIISRTEKSTIHINFMISRVDRYMRRTTLQNARTCGGILFPIKSGKRKGLNKFIINHYMNLLCSSLLVVPFDHAVLKKLTFCNLIVRNCNVYYFIFRLTYDIECWYFASFFWNGFSSMQYVLQGNN